MTLHRFVTSAATRSTGRPLCKGMWEESLLPIISLEQGGVIEYLSIYFLKNILIPYWRGQIDSEQETLPIGPTMIWLETVQVSLVNGRGPSTLAIIWCPWSQHQNWNLNPHNSTWDLGVSSISANPLSVCFNKIYLFALKTRVTEREREDERASGKQWREIDLSAISLPPLPHPDSWLQWPILSQTIAKSFIGFPL